MHAHKTVLRLPAEIARSANQAGGMQPAATASQSTDEEEEDVAEERASWSFERQTGAACADGGKGNAPSTSRARVLHVGCTHLDDLAGAPLFAAEMLVAGVVAQWQKPIDTLSKAGRAFDVSRASGSWRLALPSALLLRYHARSCSSFRWHACLTRGTGGLAWL